MKDISQHEDKPTTSHPEPASAGGQCEDIRAKARNAYEAGKEWERGFVKRVQQNPIQSLLIAGGMGMLAGLLLRRR